MSDAVCRDYAEITDVRASDPQAVERAWQTRTIRPAVRGNGRLMIVAADHPARGALGVGSRPTAMNSRTDLLDRLRAALADPGVDGVLATADILDDLLLLGALEDKVVFSSMNRGGLAGAQFELDDRMTATTAAATAAARMNGGKMLCRIDLGDPGTVSTLEACARAVDELAAHGLIAMVEPFLSTRVDGKVRNDLSPDAVIKSVHISQGLGSTSAYTWMKLPVVDEMDRVMESTTLPTLLLGGDPADPDEAFASWEKALALPSVRGLIVGRTLLYPADDDVSSAVATAVSMVRRGAIGMHSKYYIPARSATLPYTVDITPESAGWTEASLQVVELKPMQELALETGDTEVMILPLAGGGTVDCGNEAFELAPRASVFDGPADMVYIGIGQSYTLCGEGRFAICGARAKRQLPNRRVAAADVSVELRGTGNCSRQVHNFGTAGVFEADSLIACEVITPGGNWSSYPAHKHDEETPVESALEEIYYFEIASGPDGSRGFGYHRVYGTPDRPIEVLEEVRTGDVVLVPHGYHGPSVAAPGYHMYYLNVMAGPGEERAWKIVDDPEHAWLRGTWDDQAVDPEASPAFTRSVNRGFQRSAFKSPHTEPTVRLTVAQATVRFLANQYVERDGERSKFFAGCFGIFGHGNVAGMGQALLQDEVEAAEAGRRRPCARRSRRAGAAIRAGPQRAGDGAHRRRVRPAEGPAADLGRDRQHRARVHQHAHRRGTGHHQPAAGTAAAVRHLRHPGQRAGAAGTRTAPRQRDAPSTTRSSRCRGSSTGCGGRSSCPRHCSARCGC